MTTQLKNQVPLDLLVPYLIYEYVTGEAPYAHSYENRLLWQKVGFLSKELGVPMNEYCFNWYKAGPYSPSYTSVLYRIDDSASVMEKLKNNYSLTDEIKTKLLPLKQFITKKPQYISLPRWFELLASILYLKNESPSLNREAILKRLVRKKPHFDNSLLNQYAWNILSEKGLI